VTEEFVNACLKAKDLSLRRTVGKPPGMAQRSPRATGLPQLFSS
jgi:hypothetical protein